MRHDQSTIGGIDEHDGAAIDIYRKHDSQEPPLYFAINLFNGDADESGGQITQELLEVHEFRVSCDFSGRSSRYDRAAILLFRATNHTVYCRSWQRRQGGPKRALLVSLLYVRSIGVDRANRTGDRIKQRLFFEWFEHACDRIRLRPERA